MRWWWLDHDRLLDQTRHGPSLGLRDRTRFRDLDDVAQLVFVVLVVRVVLARLRDDLAVQLVLGAALDQHGDGLRALVADDLADQRAGVLHRRFGCGGGGLLLAHFFASFFFWASTVLA